MPPETRTCQNCKQSFVIEPDDFAFYEKIKVPPPTFCPECRAVRRRAWRNERTLYHRKCDLCKKEIISMFPASAPFPVYCNECWYSDGWDPLVYGRSYDFGKPFFAQYKALQDSVPRMGLAVINNKNSPYLNYAWNSNNSYMCLDLGYGENCLYSNACHFIKDSSDNSYCKKIELCHGCIDSRESTRSDTLEKCEGCIDSHFLYDCRGCSSCILCAGLRNKKYHILNQPYSKEDYEKAKSEYAGGSFAKRERAKKLFEELKLKALHKENNNIQAVRCTGDNIWNCENCRQSFNVFRSQNCKRVNDVDSDVKDSVDLSNAAEGELMYEGTSASGSNVRFSVWVTSVVDVQYSSLCVKNNSHLFGCIALRDKSNCILNKQYSEEEYQAMIPKIIEHMNAMPYVDKKGRVYRYGEFFPIELSTFPYNDSKSYEFNPLTKEQIMAEGYGWRDPEERHYAPTKTDKDLPDHIKDVVDSLLNDVIACSHGGTCTHQCATAFKIIPEELRFYRAMNLPLPRLCANCRYYERTAHRNPMKLWHRGCTCAGAQSANGVHKNTVSHPHGASACPIEFETSYAPDRPEIVYCEACYNAEVV